MPQLLTQKFFAVFSTSSIHCLSCEGLIVGKCSIDIRLAFPQLQCRLEINELNDYNLLLGNLGRAKIQDVKLLNPREPRGGR